MGRRKIEIQPITHERNRSVTFQKRKYGLFKKAYELGVLCSVDVAVIIFEEKPGHHAKLYQYCSSDVHDIVQRHLRHDGEKESRGTADFSGVPSAKFEGDEEDLDDEEDLRRGVKRRNDTHVKPEEAPFNLYGDVAPPPVQGINSTVPISADRSNLHHPLSPNKRPRYAGAAPLGSDRNPRDSYNISPTSQGFSRAHHGPSSYNAYLAGATSPTTYQPESTFPATSVHTTTRDSRNGNSGTASYPPRSTAYDAALYTPIMRHSMGSGGNSAGGEYLDGESRSRASGSSAHLGNNIDWPDSGGSGYNSNAPVSNNTQNTTPANENTWLDFLSSNPTHGSQSVSNAPDATGRRHSDSMPWERGAASRSSIGSPYTRSMASVGDGIRRSRINSVSGENNPSASGGNAIPSGLSISVKQEKDVGG